MSNANGRNSLTVVVHNGVWAKVTSSSYLKTVVLNDVHFPFCDTTALALACKLIEVIEPHMIILNGDIVDFFGISRYSKDPARSANFYREVELNTILLKRWFFDRFGGVVWIYVEGNHENRMQDYIWRRAKELAHLRQLDWEQILEVPDNVFVLKRTDTPQPDSSFCAPMVAFQSLFVAHGDLFRLNGNTINVARCLFYRVLHNIVIGHWHRSDEYIQLNIDGKAYGAWVVPCLALPRPHWDASRIWGQGIAVIETSNGFFKVENIKMVRDDGGKMAFYGGKKITVKQQKGVDYYELKRKAYRVKKVFELQG